MNLAGAATAFRDMAGRAKSGLALAACEEAAKDYLAILRVVTPKRTGALAESETIDSISGGGTHARAVVAPHKVYAAFREHGGTIHAKAGLGRKGMRPHTLHWEGGGFPLHVTQAGAHYMEKARGAAAGPVALACQRAADEFFTLP